MSDEDLEIIPILEDVLVAGDLDKAVTGDIDVNDLESIERFDALFENQQSNDNEAPEENLTDKSTEDENVLESTDDDTFFSPDLDLLSGNEHQDENVSYDTKNESVETEHIKEDNSAFIQEANELANSNQTLINQAFDDFDEDEDDDIDVEEAIEFQGEVTSEPEISETFIPDAEPEQQSLESINQQPIHQEPTNQELASQDPEPEIDLSEIVEKVTQDIMPALETQIRRLVLASLEKHLTDSVNISTQDTSIDTDKDL